MTDSDHPLDARQVQILLHNASKIISGPDGELVTSEVVRRLIVFFSNGVLIVANNARYDPNVMTAREDIRRKGYAIEEEFSAEASVIAALYAAKTRLERAG